MIAIVHSIYSQSVHAPARDAGLMDNDAERYCTSFDKQKKSAKNTLLSKIKVAILKKVVIVRRRLYCKICSSVRPFECYTLNVYHVMGSW